MVFLKSTTLVALIALYLPGIHSSPYLLSDDRVRDLDVTPVLGRGYSVMTNTFQSTCLLVNATSTPSYNYDCKCWTRLVSITLFG